MRALRCCDFYRTFANMSNPVTVKFVDFWPGFEAENNPFTAALRARRQVTVLPDESSVNPDILFYSRCGQGRHYEYDCLKIYYTGENDFPDFNECDYAISFYPDSCGGRNLRYPLFMFYDYKSAIAPHQPDDSEALSRGFCSLVMSNATNCHPDRLKIIDAVESYKPIAYGGAFRNNIGGRTADKLDFISRYKFNLALENSSMPGYVTEKILEPLATATVPVYWGADAVKSDFNPDSFIYVGDYDNLDSFVEALKAVDSDSGTYLAMLRAGSGIAGRSSDFDSQLEDFLNRIADNPVRIIQPYGEIAVRYRRNRVLVPLSYKKGVMRLAGLLSGKSRKS